MPFFPNFNGITATITLVITNRAIYYFSVVLSATLFDINKVSESAP